MCGHEAQTRAQPQAILLESFQSPTGRAPSQGGEEHQLWQPVLRQRRRQPAQREDSGHASADTRPLSGGKTCSAGAPVREEPPKVADCLIKQEHSLAVIETARRYTQAHVGH